MSVIEVPVASLSEVDDWIKKGAGACFELPREVFDHVVQDIPSHERGRMKLEFVRPFIAAGRLLICPVSHVDVIYTRDWPFAHRWFIARDSAKAVYRFVLGNKSSLPFMSLGV